MSLEQITSAAVTPATDLEEQTVKISSRLPRIFFFTPKLSDFKICKRICQNFTHSFKWCILTLPFRTRKHVYALYAFARIADEICDNPWHDSTMTLKFLQIYERSFYALCRGEKIRSLDILNSSCSIGVYALPVLRAMSITTAKFSLPLENFATFFASMYRDVPASSTFIDRYQTKEQLEEYIDGSAETFGILLLPFLIKDERLRNNPKVQETARALGAAFQLTNFMRDIAEDYAKGRIYIPHELLEQESSGHHEVHEAMNSTIPSATLQAALRNWHDEIEILYEKAHSGLPYIHRSMRLAIWIALELYREIANKIALNNYNVFQHPIGLSKQERISIIIRRYCAEKKKSLTGNHDDKIYTPTDEDD